MANNETTMRFNADISGLKKGIADANRQIRIANSAFKSLSSGMDFAADSADGISAKIEQLTAVQDAEKTKLQLLQRQYELTAAEMGETSKEAEELQIRINNQQATINRVGNELQNYRNKLDNIGNTTASTVSALDRLTTEISQQENELKTLQRAYANYVIDGNEASEEARQLATQITELSGDLNRNRNALRDANAAAGEFANAMDDAADAADDTAGNMGALADGFTVVKGAIADLLADAIRACIDGFKELAVEGDAALNSFQAQTGTSTAAMAEFGEQIQEIYKSNFGENMQDVADAMAQVAQTSKETDPSKIKELTQNALILRDTFGFEINETMRGANMLMDQFGLTGEQAFNLIAQGAQNGLNKNGDLLDSVNEYSVHYSQLGYTAEEFFNSLSNGTAAGTFSVDKLGDAMKEFGIRTKDTAQSTTEGFELIGLNADEMRSKFAAGGDSAKQATQETLNALYGMTDSVKQNQAGVALFGTMWEDLGIDAVKSLTDVNGEADKTAATMEEINAVKYNDLGSMFAEVGRILKVELLQPIVDELKPAFKDFVDWLKGDAIPWLIDNGNKLVATVVSIGAAFAAFKAVTIIQGIISAFAALIPIIKSVGLAQAALNLVMSLNPVGLIVAAISALVAGFIYLWNTSDEFRAFWVNLWETIKTTASTVIDAVVEFFTGMWDGITNAVTTVKDKIVGFFTGIVTFFKDNWQSLLMLLVNPFAGAFKLIYDNSEGFRDFIDGIVQAVAGFFKNLWDGISAAAGTAWEKIKGFFAPAVEWFTQLLTSIWATVESVITVIVGLAKGCWAIIQRVFEVVGDWFKTNVIDPVLQFFTTLWTNISDAAKSAWDFIVNVYKAAAQWYYNTVIKPVIKFFTTLWTTLKSGAKSAWTAISGAFKAAASWFNNTLVKPVTSFFGNMWDKLKSGAKSAWDGIKSVFSVVTTWFKDKFTQAWTAVKNVFSTGGKIFDGIKDGIVSTFKTVVNGIIRGINKIIKIPFNAINSMLNKIRDVSVMDISPFAGMWSENPLSIPQIPELAKGGILKRGQVGLLEGDGAEAVVPIEKNTQWIKRVAAEMLQQFNDVGGVASSQLGGGTVNNYTYNHTVNSPKALNRLEIYRQGKQQMAFIKAVTS